MTVKLYTYSGENIRVDKTDYLSSPVSFNADLGFEGNQNVESPSVIIRSSSEPPYNYAYIDEYHRYYYIISKTWLSNDLWRLSMVVDPLYTYRGDINIQRGTVLYSGVGNIKKYDPRLVYNNVPEKTFTESGLDGGDIWIVLGCKYFYFTKFLSKFSDKMNNSMSYIAFSPEAYAGFITNLGDPNASSSWREEVSKTIVFATLVRYLNLSRTTIPRWTTQEITSGGFDDLVYFSSPEIFQRHAALYETYPTGLGVLTWDDWEPEPEIKPAMYQFTNEQIKEPYRVFFADSCKTYAERKAQRILELPYIGNINLDLDNLGVPLEYDNVFLGVDIRYDFGGNEYVVMPWYALKREGAVQPTPEDIIYCRDTMLSIPNNYQIGFVSDDSHQFENETMQAQLLGLVSTAVMGVIAGIATEGASVPATAASLGVGVANMALTENKLQYQEAASVIQKGSSNGGSAYDTLITIL